MKILFNIVVYRDSLKFLNGFDYLLIKIKNFNYKSNYYQNKKKK
jgi:hypothetical protein